MTLDIQTFLTGKDGIRPLQHSAAALRQFVAQFEQVSMPEKTAETLAQLNNVMQKTEWNQAHDAALSGIASAKNDTMLYIINAMIIDGLERLPNIKLLQGIQSPELKEHLAPLLTYLENFKSFVEGWAVITPSKMRLPEGVEGFTPAQCRLTAAPLPSVCNDPKCTIDHGIKGAAEAIGVLPQVKPSTLLLGGAAAVTLLGVSAYLINAYGKADKKDNTPPERTDWKARSEASAPSEARTL
jgi:hypothetical protein